MLVMLGGTVEQRGQISKIRNEDLDRRLHHRNAHGLPAPCARLVRSPRIDTTSGSDNETQKMKIRKCSISLFAGLIASVVAISAAPAEQPSSRLDEIITRGSLRVGMTGDYKPFSYFDKTNDKFSGFDVDMAEALGKALGVKVEYVHTAWPQLMKDFEADKFDIAMGGVSITLDRQKKGYFSMPIMREGKTPITRCNDMAKYQTLDTIDQPGTRVITNPGGTNERFARAHIKHADIKVYGDNVTIFF